MSLLAKGEKMDQKITGVAQTIKSALSSARGPYTIADVSTKSGLALRDAEVGMHYLVSEYRGHLAVTEKGELLFRFPTGFTKPWEKVEGLQRFWTKVKKGFMTVAKFVVRAWISIVMIAYVAIFALILIGLMFARKSDDDERGHSNDGGFAFAMLMRLVADSLFWTFHPLEPYHARRKSDAPFYERVNRYFFGPEDAVRDPNAATKKMLAMIRAKRGRIGISDIIKVTGLSQPEADPIIAKLLLDYDGEVSVSENGTLVYTFREIRKSVQNAYIPEPAPIWSVREKLKPLTGNTAGTNFLITALNGFNLVMSAFMITQHQTIARLLHAQSLPTSAALFLGYIPLVFSALLFLFPITRWLNQSAHKRRVDRENGKRGLLFAVFSKLTQRGVTETAIKSAWEQVSQSKADDKAIVQEVVRFGGDLEIADDGSTTFRFKQLEAELHALREEREKASETETQVGSVVFAT